MHQKPETDRERERERVLISFRAHVVFFFLPSAFLWFPFEFPFTSLSLSFLIERTIKGISKEKSKGDERKWKEIEGKWKGEERKWKDNERITQGISKEIEAMLDCPAPASQISSQPASSSQPIPVQQPASTSSFNLARGKVSQKTKKTMIFPKSSFL